MQNQYIIFFDGQCNLCDRFIGFVFKRDSKRRFFYAPLQGQTAKQKLTIEEARNLKSIIFLQKGTVLKEAPAIQAIMKQLYPRWSFMIPILSLGMFNFLYRFIARKRYTLFGKKDKLYQPSEEQKKYFLP